jgi:DNA ligase-1
MRLGLHDGLVPDAVAAAAGVDAGLVRRALGFRSDPSAVATLALAEGEAGLRAVAPSLFTPILPMLAEPAPDLASALADHGGRSAVEVKYDGARIQLHKRGDTVRLWSRRLAEVTASLPEIVAAMRTGLRADSAILDGEVVAVGEGGRPLPFQELMRRFRRRHAVETSMREVPLALHLFDCLLVDGRALVDEPYARRWERLREVTGGAWLARRAVVADPEAGAAFLVGALAEGHEGVMAKALDGPYTPGTRGRRWYKVKPAETIDCLIVAADRGSGRRRGWLSNYHLAVGGPAGTPAPVGKTFKGLTDAEFAAMTTRLSALAIADDGYTVRVRPEVVVEVAYNEIQRSPQYASGLALRFARIVRIREDKTPADVTSLETLRALYDRQFRTKGRQARPDR